MRYLYITEYAYYKAYGRHIRKIVMLYTFYSYTVGQEQRKKNQFARCLCILYCVYIYYTQGSVADLRVCSLFSL